MLSAWALAYGTGQLVNGLLTDRIGGKTAMLIGAAGTICINLIFGFASFVGTFATFAADLADNGYMQSFGAPGMIKMNAAWFRRTERGTFAGIFGFMIQLGPVRDQQPRAGDSGRLRRWAPGSSRKATGVGSSVFRR